MAGRSRRLVSGSHVALNRKGFSSQKRGASPTSRPSDIVKRPRAAATPKKSQYFDAKATDAADSDAEDDPSSPASNDDEASDFDADDAVESSAEPSEDDEESDYSTEAPKGRKKPTPSKAGPSSSPSAAVQNGEKWRPGVKAGLGPGKQLVIKKPQARPAGKTPYQPETIHPNTLLFLGELKANNDRQWLKMHDAVFRQAEQDWYSYVDRLTEKLIEIDDTVPELPVKDVIFRIYRDIRFSPDPTPYKAHFSAAWSRTGRKGGYAHYYVQISPHGQSFVGGGLWHPDAAPTAAMRRDIDRRPQRIKSVLMDNTLREEFLEGAPHNEKKAVRAFVSRNSENALKTKPKGYDADHADIELLRLRNYTIGRKLTEAEVTGPDSLQRIGDLLTAMKPFITYINSVVMPDEESEGSEEGSEEEDDGSEEDENS